MPDSLPWDQFTNDNPVSSHSAEPVIVIGAGLAGCWVARTLAEKGVRVTVLEAGAGPARGASSNPAGIVKPFVTRVPGQAMCFFVKAHDYLIQKLNEWDLAQTCGFNACGVVQLVRKPYPASAHYQCIVPDQMLETLGVHSDAHGLLFERSGWLNPAALCRALLQHDCIDIRFDCRVDSIESVSDGAWKIIDSELSSWRTSHLVIGTGAAITQFPPSRHLPVIPARGQLSRFTGAASVLKRVVSGKHYLIPDGNTVIVGATFQRGVNDDATTLADNLCNRAGLESMLPAYRLNTDAVNAYAGVRATTPDRLPLLGPIPDAQACSSVYADLHPGRALDRYPVLPVHRGAFVHGGLGSRGIVTAPFSARLLCDHMMGGDEIREWSSLVNPARFQIRRLKRSNES